MVGFGGQELLRKGLKQAPEVRVPEVLPPVLRLEHAAEDAGGPRRFPPPRDRKAILELLSCPEYSDCPEKPANVRGIRHFHDHDL